VISFKRPTVLTTRCGISESKTSVVRLNCLPFFFQINQEGYQRHLNCTGLTTPLISVIIAADNKAKCLETCGNERIDFVSFELMKKKSENESNTPENKEENKFASILT
jgi:hypothetical protein